MKQTTVDSLLIARTLTERASGLSRSDDKHLASAGLILTQDALEMVFYALLIERSVDETRPLEKLTFDELIGELKKADVSVPKSGTLKALNKQRVLTKHYAQVAEPVTVRGYFDAAMDAIDSIAKQVIGRPLRELYLADLLKDGPSKDHLKKAESLIGEGDFREALVEIRRAIYIEFESSYSVYGWRNHERHTKSGSLAALLYGGMKAPREKRNKEWVDNNVSDPIDYIQIDHEQWRVDALEWGIHTAELSNIQRLTPSVFRASRDAPWTEKWDLSTIDDLCTEANAKYCLDRATAAILKKQEHVGSHRGTSWSAPLDAPETYTGSPIRKKATSDSEIVHIVNDSYTYTIYTQVTGFDGFEQFVQIVGESKEVDDDNSPSDWVSGYLQVSDTA